MLCTPSLWKRGLFLGGANYPRPGYVESVIPYSSFDIQVHATERMRTTTRGKTNEGRTL